MYSGLLTHCLREATSALRQNKLACRTPLINKSKKITKKAQQEVAQP